MSASSINACFRCGKERIVSKTWTELLVNTSGMRQEVVYTEAVCPDAACQKLLDKDLRKQRKKREDIARERLQTAKARKAKKKITPKH